METVADSFFSRVEICLNNVFQCWKVIDNCFCLFEGV